MQPDLIAPVVLVVIAVVVVVSTQLVTPSRARRRLARSMASHGWTPVDPADEPAWAAVEALAIEGDVGASRESSSEERFGAVSVHYERSERRAGRTRSLYRRDGDRRPLYAADGVRTTRTETRSGRLLPSYRRRSTGARELWIGQRADWDVAAPELVYSAGAERFGESLRDLASKRGVDPERIPGLPSPTSANPSLALREALQRTETAQQVMLSLYVGPQAWVMTAPLGRGATRLEPLLALAAEISAVVDAIA